MMQRSLPYELWGHIFSHISLWRQLKSLSLVCRQCRRVLLRHQESISFETRDFVKGVAPQNRIQAQLEAAVSCFASLNTLSISHCDSIRPETIDGVLKAVGKQITTFKMAVAYYGTDQVLTSLSKYCPNLTYLDAAGCRKVSDTGLDQIRLSRCAYTLQTLIIHGCHLITNEGMSNLFRTTTALRHLDMNGFVNSNKMVADSIAATLKNLRRLDMQTCPDASAALLPQLFRSLPSIHSINMKMSILKTIDVSDFVVDARSVSLRVFECQCSPSMDDAFLDVLTGQCPEIRELNISECPRVTTVGMRYVGRLIHLRRLESKANEQVDDEGFIAVAKGCCQLEIFNVEGVSISDAVVEAVVRGSGKSLKTLNLGGSERITDFAINVRCGQLITAQCAGIQNLAIRQSPRITLDAIVQFIKERHGTLMNQTFSYNPNFVPITIMKAVETYCPLMRKLDLGGCFPKPSANDVDTFRKKTRTILQLSH